MTSRKADLSISVRRMSDLLEGGLPLFSCLDALERQTENRPLRDAIHHLKRRVSDGMSFSRALADSDFPFPPVMSDMAKIGEESGALETVFRHLADFLESDLEFRQKVRSALTYPAFLVVLSIIVSGFIVGFVVPKFNALFTEIGASLPWPTRLLMAIAAVFRNPSFPLLTAGVFLLGMPLAGGRLSVSTFSDALISRVSPVRRWIQAFWLRRWFHIMEILLKSGFPLYEAIKLSRTVLSVPRFSGHLDDLQRRVFEGMPLSRAMASSHVFPPHICEMTAIGEETADLETVFERLFRTYERETTYALRRFLSFLEPALILAMGAVVGFVATAMMLPIFEMSANLK